MSQTWIRRRNLARAAVRTWCPRRYWRLFGTGRAGGPWIFSIYRKKVVFCLVVGGVTPPPLSGPTTKKTTFFLCVSSLTRIVILNLKEFELDKMQCNIANIRPFAK